ncbi:MAG: heme ABC exporter ATP-binding protein CcmA [Alphaproteobacteria bacterium]
MSRFEGRDLVCVRGERVVFAGLTFALASGDALLLVGPNGSGKSTLLRLMAGLLRPAAGSILWQGAPITADPGSHNRRLHYVGHLDAVKPALTVRENLSFWASFNGSSRTEDAISGALRHFAIEHLSDIPARLLSAGQRRRLSLSRLLAVKAPLWLLDEPTVALDRASIAALAEAVRQHRENGGMAVIATHAAIEMEAAITLELSGSAGMRTDEIWVEVAG